MKRILITLSALGIALCTLAAEPAPYAQITNIGARTTYSLNGGWRTLVDLYEEGAYNYRGLPKPLKQTFFVDKRFFDDETKLVEYDFDVAPLLQVPGDAQFIANSGHDLGDAIAHTRSFTDKFIIILEDEDDKRGELWEVIERGPWPGED